ncbi:MAG: hypothetical protein M3N98_07650, partial [Actinomycetota bacterium]|nr:hypothetical protein [Actinomycetota bacterium]
MNPRRGGRKLLVTLAAVAALMPFLMSVPSASAAITLSAGPDFNGSGPYKVGDTGKFGSFTITNTSDGMEGTGPITICT